MRWCEVPFGLLPRSGSLNLVHAYRATDLAAHQRGQAFCSDKPGALQQHDVVLRMHREELFENQ